MAGVVRAHAAASEIGMPRAVGSRLEFADTPRTPPVTVFPTDTDSYARLCRLLSLGKSRAPKGECILRLHDLLEHESGLLAVVHPPRALDDHALDTMRGLRRAFDDDRLSIAATRTYRANDQDLLGQLADLSRHLGIPLVASNGVLYHEPGRRRLQDVVTCIRRGTTIEQAGLRLNANAERHLKDPEEMVRLFVELPGAVDRSVEIALRAAAFSLDQLRYEYPAEACPAGCTPSEYLRHLVFAGARGRYPSELPERGIESLEHELSLISELRYEPYFLTCYDIVRFARSRGILCQGRGGAANSAVCYCLGITEVDPSRYQLLFERFISRERNEPPDIDIDFEHERREEVLQYIYGKYGRDHAAMTAEVVSYRGRSAVREIAKVMGLAQDTIDEMARNLDRWGEAPSSERISELGLDPSNPTLVRILELTEQLIGFPRHLSQHVGGMVITDSPLTHLVPIENAAMGGRTVIEWDKDDIDALGMLKIDCLGLGMLTCIRKAFELLEEQGITNEEGGRLTIADVMQRESADEPV